MAKPRLKIIFQKIYLAKCISTVTTLKAIRVSSLTTHKSVSIDPYSIKGKVKANCWELWIFSTVQSDALLAKIGLFSLVWFSLFLYTALHFGLTDLAVNRVVAKQRMIHVTLSVAMHAMQLKSRPSINTATAVRVIILAV